MNIHAVKARNSRKTQSLILQPQEVGPPPSSIKVLLKAIAAVSGTLIFWTGIALYYTYLFFVFFVFLALWRGEYFGLAVSGLIAIGVWIILRYAAGAIMIVGGVLRGVGVGQDE
jgi:hypothetical protein